MSPEVLAALLGVLGGVLIERVARSWGRLWCEPASCEITPRSGNRGVGIKTETDPQKAEWVADSVRLDLFNGKEIPVGFRDVALEYHCAGGRTLRSVPMDKATEYTRQVEQNVPGTRRDPSTRRAYVVNLPPRQWVVMELFDSFHERHDILLLFRCYRIEFVGEWQKSGLLRPKTFRKTIASRLAFPDPFRRWGPVPAPFRYLSTTNFPITKRL